MTPLYLLIDRCGLSQQVCGKILGVTEHSVYNMASGRRRTPEGILNEMVDLYSAIENTARKMLIRVNAKARKDPTGDIVMHAGIEECQNYGLPHSQCVVTAIGLVIARSGLKPERFVIKYTEALCLR